MTNQKLWNVKNGVCSHSISLDVRPTIEGLGTEGFEGLARNEMMGSLRNNYRELSRLPGLLTNRTYIGRDDYILYYDKKCVTWILSEPLMNGYQKTLWFFKEGSESKRVYQVKDKGLRLVNLNPIEICVSESITNTDWYLHRIKIN